MDPGIYISSVLRVKSYLSNGRDSQPRTLITPESKRVCLALVDADPGCLPQFCLGWDIILRAGGQWN